MESLATVSWSEVNSEYEYNEYNEYNGSHYKYAIQHIEKIFFLIFRILSLNARANPDCVVDVGDSPPQGFLFVYSSQFSALFK